MSVKLELCSEILKLFFVVLGVTCSNLQVGKHGRRQATFERFNNTCGLTNTSLIFTYDGLKSEGNKLLINSTITAKHDVLSDPRLVIGIDRCKNRENLDTCEHFYDYKADSYCSTVEATDSPLWAPLYSKYEPKFTCPIKKGVYRAINSTVDVSAYLLFPVDAWFWKVKIATYDRNDPSKTVMCLIAETHISTN